MATGRTPRAGNPSSTRRLFGIGLLALAGAALALGPRATVTEPITIPSAIALGVPESAEALERWLMESEDAVGDVLPHATKLIVWADPVGKSRTETVVVYIHGFSATRQEVAPLADSVAAALDANLYYTRLTGHGRPGPAMGDATPDDWTADLAEVMAVAERLGDNVVLMGTSTGGTLATWAASRPEWAARLKALVLLSPNYAVQAGGAWVFGLPWGGWVANRIAGSERSWEAFNALQEEYWTTAYPTDAVATMMAWLRHVEKLEYEGIETPVWIGLSLHDQVVQPEATELVFAALGSRTKTLTHLENGSDPSHHILAGDVLAPEHTVPVARRITEFLAELESGAGR